MYNLKSSRSTWVEIDLKALMSNLDIIYQHIGSQNKLVVVLKADAYGHGAVQIAQEVGVKWDIYFAVSSIDEGIELRSNGISAPIMVLGPVETPAFSKLLEFNIIPAIHSIEYANALIEIYHFRGIYPRAHFNVNTGMNRLGCDLETAQRDIQTIFNQSELVLEGIFSHLSSADTDPDFTKNQIKNFSKLCKQIQEKNNKKRYYHIANTNGLFDYPQSVKDPFNMARIGIGLYLENKERGLQTVMSLKSNIVDIQKRQKNVPISYCQTYFTKIDNEYIAVLPIGYADGIPVLYSNKGTVEIKGHFYPVVGRITMDYTMISLGENKEDIKAGDTATFFGDSGQSIDEFVKNTKQLNYEAFCGISKRVPRVYIRN